MDAEGQEMITAWQSGLGACLGARRMIREIGKPSFRGGSNVSEGVSIAKVQVSDGAPPLFPWAMFGKPAFTSPQAAGPSSGAGGGTAAAQGQLFAEISPPKHGNPLLSPRKGRMMSIRFGWRKDTRAVNCIITQRLHHTAASSHSGFITQRLEVFSIRLVFKVFQCRATSTLLRWAETSSH